MLWHKLSELPVVSKIRGRARGAGSELALARDMWFAAWENAILGQIEVGVGALLGAGGVQHLARLLGRGRAMEAIIGAGDFDAEMAERYGWINRALPRTRPRRPPRSPLKRPELVLGRMMEWWTARRGSDAPGCRPFAFDGVAANRNLKHLFACHRLPSSRRLRQSHCETTPGPGLNDFDHDELGGA